MAKKKNYKKTVRKVAKAASKMPTGALIAIIVVVILVIGIGAAFVLLKPDLIKNLINPETSQNVNSSSEENKRSSRPTTSYAPGEVAPIDINFLELGNKYTGDSTFIKAGDVDILIDAGSRQNSAAAIKGFVDTYCEDGVLEYVIATHAHQDHIAGFVGSNAAPGIFNSYKIDTLIDFSLTNASSTIYNNYVSLRDQKIASGDIAHHYQAHECIAETNGAKRTYELTAGITMEILDQKFYREKTSDENDYSVCALFSQGNSHYLFTGDLEKDGEASLVELNNLPEVNLFKGGHHGSYTANTDTLLSVIKPKTVCICCCAGSTEYTTNLNNTFPAQAAIDRIGKYTDEVYVTTVANDSSIGYESMNGTINYHSDNGETYLVTGSNNSLKLKETEWFKNNRTWPS